MVSDLEIAYHAFTCFSLVALMKLPLTRSALGRRNLAEEAEQADKARDLECVTNGDVMECGCCYETVTMPKITHCDGDETHFFCLECARRNANNDIGNSQYTLRCMDFSGCTATFSREQRTRFLDEKTRDKLERLQQQDELRLAGLDNLATCPFCDFAAIYPPIAEDREFRCQNPQCAEVSSAGMGLPEPQ